MTREPVGILGGIFDPVHNGHLSIASLARDFFHLRRVIFIPAGTPPHKSSSVVAGPADRVSMLDLAIKSEPSFTIWEGEIDRSGYSFTVDSLKALRKIHRNSDFYFIIGSDNLTEIDTWKDYREIIAMVKLCVGSRPGFPVEVPQSLASADIREFPSPEWGISSTMIRDYLLKGYNCRYLLPEAVIGYIESNGVYS